MRLGGESGRRKRPISVDEIEHHRLGIVGQRFHEAGAIGMAALGAEPLAENGNGEDPPTARQPLPQTVELADELTARLQHGDQGLAHRDSRGPHDRAVPQGLDIASPPVLSRIRV